MPPKPKRPRTLRREASRAAADLARDRERLFKLSPGGRSESPIDVASASVVEIRAASVPCPRCDGEQLVEEHVAIAGSDGARLREVRLRCRRCGSKRSMWFRLPTVN
ncbi:MAG TPA: hypothetical protein VHC69_31225 [Polyangiaceae bacterium]|nr:hypothetical protein [Polyangiaceae bacterium]